MRVKSTLFFQQTPKTWKLNKIMALKSEKCLFQPRIQSTSNYKQ